MAKAIRTDKCTLAVGAKAIAYNFHQLARFLEGMIEERRKD